MTTANRETRRAARNGHSPALAVMEPSELGPATRAADTPPQPVELRELTASEADEIAGRRALATALVSGSINANVLARAAQVIEASLIEIGHRLAAGRVFVALDRGRIWVMPEPAPAAGDPLPDEGQPI